MCLRKCPCLPLYGKWDASLALRAVWSRAAACDDKIQEPYRRELIPDYDEVRDVCLNGGAATLWISGSGSTLMAVTDDGLVAESLRARLQSMHPDFQVHVLECDTQGVRIQLA